MSSQHPMLYLQGPSGTHTIIFRMGASGRDPVVAEHRISAGLPTHLASPEGEDVRRFVMKGRKGLCYTVCEGSSELRTCLVGNGGLASWFSAELGLPDDGNWDEHEARLVDFDERTGRILIGTNRPWAHNNSEATRIYLADLPP